MLIEKFIETNNLNPADAIELVDPKVPYVKHYAVYLGYENDIPMFVANRTDGIALIPYNQLVNYIKTLEVTLIEPFTGSYRERLLAVKRAISRIGEKAYNLVFNNCEHFKNWVLYGIKESKQVTNVAVGLTSVGIGAYLIGHIFENKNMRKFAFVLIVFIIVIAILYYCGYIAKQSNYHNSILRQGVG